VSTDRRKEVSRAEQTIYNICHMVWQSRAEQTWRKKKRSALLEAPLEVLP
jgi:hypothetical protein